MYTKRIQLINYGPIDKLDIACPFDGDKPKPLVFVGENGSGKSILLSQIVNGLLAAQQMAFPDTPEIATGKVYKLRSSSYIRSGAEFYFSRVDFEDDLHIADLQLARRKQDYKGVPTGIQETLAHDLWNRMRSADTSTMSPQFGALQSEGLFDKNCILYFPPNRFEDPAWLNADNLTAKARRTSPRRRKGETERSVINHAPLRENENWLFDVAYDFNVFEQLTQRIPIPVETQDKSKVTVPLPVFFGYAGRAKTLYDIALRIVQVVIQGQNIQLGFGTRDNRVVSVLDGETSHVPNIFQLSSGEVSLLNLFLSILRDFDMCREPISKPDDVRGIAVVDEVDLHLHAMHQYDVLPRLVQMFPRIQFVLTTHSPLFALGLRQTLGRDGFALYELPNARSIAPEDFSEFGEAHRAFKKTKTYLEEMEKTVSRIENPVVFVDGATDVKYLRRAVELLNARDVLCEAEIRGGGGDGNLKNAWKTLTSVDIVRQTVVLLHDCDSNVPPGDCGKVFRRKIPLFDEHPVRRGVENLFSMETLAKAREHKPAFVDIIAEHSITERGQERTIPEEWKINKDEKSNLCEWLCTNGTAEDFQHFTKIFDDLRHVPGIVQAATANGDAGVPARTEE